MSSVYREHAEAYRALQETFGPQTDSIIAMLQPAPDLVNQADLSLVRSEMDVGFAQVRSEMDVGFAQVRSEMADLRTELKTEIGGLRADFKDDMTTLTVSLERRMSEAFQQQTRTLFMTIVAGFVALAATGVLQSLFT